MSTEERTNVYDGAPDARQSRSANETPSRFRPRYRPLSPEEVAQHDALKTAFGEVERRIDGIPDGRYRSLALTALEESCMWAVKRLTG